MVPATQVLKDTSMSKRKIDQVILVRGYTPIPKIQSVLSEFFGGKEFNRSINPDEAVVSVSSELLGKWPNANEKNIERLASHDSLSARVVIGFNWLVNPDVKVHIFEACFVWLLMLLLKKS